jgi:hypothetical protein
MLDNCLYGRGLQAANGRGTPGTCREWHQENLAGFTPFQRYLYDNGLFDDVIRPALSPDDEILEPSDHCSDVGASIASAIGSTMARSRTALVTIIKMMRHQRCHTTTASILAVKTVLEW